MRVAIIGAGIGGLTAALFLKRAGIEVSVFEQAPELSEVGAGIQVAPNAVRLLHRLGLAEQLQEVAVAPEIGWEFRRWEDGRVLFQQPMGQAEKSLFGAPYYVVHRADLLNVLRTKVPDRIINLGHRCVDIAQDDHSVTVTFDGGRQVNADAVIGADGIHSVVQSKIVTPSPARFSGLCAYRGIAPIDQTPMAGKPASVAVWIGPHRHFVHYPVSAGKNLNFVGIVPAGDWKLESWTAEGRVEDLRDEFRGWHGTIQGIVSAIKETTRWALYDREPLQRWTEGRVTLLGDAAHPMLPFFAQGAAQAIEDAAVLGKCLADADSETVAEALGRYEAIRKPRAVKVQQASRQRGTEYHLPDGEEQRRRDEQLAKSDPLGANAWLYGHDVEEELAAG